MHMLKYSELLARELRPVAINPAHVVAVQPFVSADDPDGTYCKIVTLVGSYVVASDPEQVLRHINLQLSGNR